ncbi:hypothetical protein SAMN05444172_7866 [Burkholderia sp. GAS332]|jgi:hypothetical protein|nr:hypothetical protein SAMN05444172_7866 [Burkholderia sp. GAS332]
MAAICGCCILRPGMYNGSTAASQSEHLKLAYAALVEAGLLT